MNVETGEDVTVTEREPIPMRLPCPECGALHLDVGEFATKVHHTHACQECGAVWRPAVVPTVGVRFLPGFKNDDEATGSLRDVVTSARDLMRTANEVRQAMDEAFASVSDTVNFCRHCGRMIVNDGRSWGHVTEDGEWDGVACSDDRVAAPMPLRPSSGTRPSRDDEKHGGTAMPGDPYIIPDPEDFDPAHIGLDGEQCTRMAPTPDEALVRSALVALRRAEPPFDERLRREMMDAIEREGVEGGLGDV